MILNKPQILKALQGGKIKFSPGLDAFQIQPNSIDLRLGTTFYIPETWRMTSEGRVGLRADYVDAKDNPEFFKMIKLEPGQFCEIMPHEFVIISTLEKIALPDGDLAAILYPRSSVLRRGIVIEGGTVNAGYEGYLTIPLLNGSNHIIKLYPGERVCHLVFHELTGALTADDLGGASKYQSSTPYGLDAKLDKQEEIDLIKAGKLDELKTTHPITKASEILNPKS